MVIEITKTTITRRNEIKKPIHHIHPFTCSTPNVIHIYILGQVRVKIFNFQILGQIPNLFLYAQKPINDVTLWGRGRSKLLIRASRVFGTING